MKGERAPGGGWEAPGPLPDQTWEEHLEQFPDPKPKRKRRKRRKQETE